jgi:Na+/H+ antiporter NhaD/arsenite permease-like protein
MMELMKNGRPWIQVHFAYPRLMGGAKSESHFRSPRVIISAVAIVLAGLALALRLLPQGTSPATSPAVGIVWVAPFALLLLGIALIPGIFPRWWEHYDGWFCMGLGVAAAAVYMLRFGGAAVAGISASMSLYIDFIVLLGALFIIASGLVVRLNRSASPMLNVLVLLLAAVLANVFGSMGASVLLARPFFRMNRGRVKAFHVVFYVMIAANVGAALTTLGDPPLLLGFLSGIPFWFITIHAWPAWLLAVGLLLAMFYILDRRCASVEGGCGIQAGGTDDDAEITIDGAEQILLLLAALGAVFLPSPWRVVVLILLAAVSLLICPNNLRKENRFNFKPIREIAILFCGIFLTMAPVLNLLGHQAGDGNLRNWLNSPGKCFFTAGALSCVLDNAPTYMAILQARLAEHSTPAAMENQFHTTARPLISPVRSEKMTGAAGQRAAMRKKIADPKVALDVLAISLGAVFFGGLTWIGNGPNLMIRAIAQQEGVVCPGFVAYLFRYALPMLLPVLLLVWLIFFYH